MEPASRSQRSHLTATEIKKVTRLQMARLANLAQDMKLDEEIRTFWEEAILKGLDKALAAEKTRVPQRALEDFLLKIRHRVEAGSDWSQLAGISWELLAQFPTPEAGSKVLELACLYGATDDALDVLKQIAKFPVETYFTVNPELRSYLLLKLWLAKQDKALRRFLQTPGFDDRLLPLERLYNFWLVFGSDDPSRAFVYYQRHEEELAHAVQEFGAKLQLSEGRFKLTVGKLAMQAGYEAIARRVLESISKDAAEYRDALQLLLHVNIEKDDKGQCPLTRKLAAEKGWRERLKLFYEFLGESRRLGAIKDAQRPALNELLKDPLKWVPAIPEAWAAVSQMICDFASMEDILPDLYAVWINNAVRFHPFLADKGLWGPVRQLQSGDACRDSYWQGIAHFHYFVAGGDEGERDLWEAFEKIQAAESQWGRPLPVGWQGLHQGATQFIAKSPLLAERHRISKLRQLSIAVGARQLTQQDIAEYLLKSESVPSYVLDHLDQLARRSQFKEVEYRIIEKRAKHSHYTNRELDRLWDMATQDQDHDLAWRVATVLNARGTLLDKAQHAWGISGEKRNEYALHKLPWNLARHLLDGLDKEEHKFLSAVLKVGPLLPDLVALTDDKVKIARPAPVKAGTMEAAVEGCLGGLDWLAAPRRHYRFSHDGIAMGGLQVPSFIQVLPNNTWSYLLIRLGERLGLSAWLWQLSWLNQKLEGVMPKLAMGVEDKFSGQIAKWLKTLGPEQRSAWYDLVAMAGKMTDQRGLELLTLLVSRLAVVLNQNHFQALQSLRTMRTPVHVIWQVENWILSSNYGKIRRTLGTLNRVPVPGALQGISILKRLEN